MIILSAKDKAKVRKMKTTREVSTPNTPRAEVLAYQAELRDLNRDLLKVDKSLNDLIAGGATPKEIRDFLNTQHDRMTVKYSIAAPKLGKKFVNRVSRQNKRSVDRSFARALRLDASDVTTLAPQEIEDVRELAILENVQLIKSIPQQHFSKVADAISRNFRGIPQEDSKSLAGRLQDIGRITLRRGNFIGRDQTAKVNSALTQARHQAAGVNKYLWSTSKDSRVVGNPGGLYPKATRGHGNHYKREGNVFYYNKPPADGPPGQAYNCRCKAVAIIDPRDLIINGRLANDPEFLRKAT